MIIQFSLVYIMFVCQTQMFWENLKGKDNLVDLGIDGENTIKDLKEIGRCGLDLYRSKED